MAMMMYCCTGVASEKEKADQATPSLEMLEFLAELTLVEGKWVSPLDMQDNKVDQQSTAPKDKVESSTPDKQADKQTKEEEKK